MGGRRSDMEQALWDRKAGERHAGCQSAQRMGGWTEGPARGKQGGLGTKRRRTALHCATPPANRLGGMRPRQAVNEAELAPNGSKRHESLGQLCHFATRPRVGPWLADFPNSLFLKRLGEWQKVTLPT
jgi:hypothetical protein